MCKSSNKSNKTSAPKSIVDNNNSQSSSNNNINNTAPHDVVTDSTITLRARQSVTSLKDSDITYNDDLQINKSIQKKEMKYNIASIPDGRRGKRDKRPSNQIPFYKLKNSSSESSTVIAKKRIRKSSHSNRENDTKSGGVEAIIPSLAVVIVLSFAIVAKMGFRGRATVAGIDLGTTNSVICVQEQSHGVGKIECIPDPYNNSPIIPSVISFLDSQPDRVPPQSKKSRIHTTTTKISSSQSQKLSFSFILESLYDLLKDVVFTLIPFTNSHNDNELNKNPLKFTPHPSLVIVGSAAKERINTHPHHTLYHAKRVIGRKFDDIAVSSLTTEVEFDIQSASILTDPQKQDIKYSNNSYEQKEDIVFRIPQHPTSSSLPSDTEPTDFLTFQPHQVGSYIIHHLISLTRQYFNHDNIDSAVIAIPAKFDSEQIKATIEAYKQANIKVTRIIQEPVAAALAYELQKKENVEYILVYDFGGGTLDVSLLFVSNADGSFGGNVEVIGSDGDDQLGGADFDAAVAHVLMDMNENYVGQVVDTVGKSLLLLEKNVLDIISRKSDDSIDGDDNGKLLLSRDFEEILIQECTILQTTPLCTVSSLHTIGEAMKIELSNMSLKLTNNDFDEQVENSVVNHNCLGFHQDDIVNVPETISEFCSSLKPIDLVLSLNQYDKACEKLYERAIIPVRRLISDLMMNPDDIDEVVMVGGTTKMPQIRRKVQEEMKVDHLNTSIDPDLTVAYGAASVID